MAYQYAMRITGTGTSKRKNNQISILREKNKKIYGTTKRTKYDINDFFIN